MEHTGYSNSMMATLNARQAIRNVTEDETISLSLRGGMSVTNSKVKFNKLVVALRMIAHESSCRHNPGTSLSK
jgi:hypothetical protein